MMEARAVTATFVQRNPTVSVFKTGSGGGTVFASPAQFDCSRQCTVPNGTTLTLTAAPHETSFFGGWSLPSCPGLGPCTFTVTDEITIGVSFTRNF